MSNLDTICFPDFDFVTGAPTVDGFTGIHDDLVITSEFDSGYVKGSRLTYGNSSGFPPVIFQGIKNGETLNMSFFCRFDLSFDLQDVVVIAIRPQVANTAQDMARRIDIFPVYEGIGADEKNAGTGGPAGTADSVVPGVPPGVNYHIRTNHASQNTVHYRGQAGAQPWTTINVEDGSTYNPSAQIPIRTRSWQPPVPTLTTSTGAQTLPTGTFNVADTTAFPAAGLFAVGGNVVRYTGKTATSFTGCTGGAGAIATGAGVSIPEVAWSIEVQVPLTASGVRWIDIQDSFGLYFAVIRTGKTPASGLTPSQGWFATQFLFPMTPPGNTPNYLTGNLNETTAINAAWYGTGLIPALQVPAGTNLGLGVRFVNDELGTGVRNKLAGMGTPFTHQFRSAAHPTAGDNQLVAKIENTSAVANNVTAEFRIANWGLPPATFPSWQSVAALGATADQPAGVTVPAPVGPATVGASVEVTWTWPKASVGNIYDVPNDHQCMWAQLTSTSPVNFTQSSVRRNMDFITMSEVERAATISGVGYPVPASGSKHDFLLVTHVRRVEIKGRGQQNSMLMMHPGVLVAGPTQDVVLFLWIVEGFRRTGKAIKIGGQAFEILDETPGSFGYIAQHQGSGDVFRSELSGGGIKDLGGGFHEIAVPHNGSVKINTRVVAEPPRRRPCQARPGDSWLVKILKAICRFFVRLFGG
jgi:hypothetical protein